MVKPPLLANFSFKFSPKGTKVILYPAWKGGLVGRTDGHMDEGDSIGGPPTTVEAPIRDYNDGWTWL
jgi:hypothetical protein